MDEHDETSTELTDEQKQQKDSRDFAAMRKRAEKAEAERDAHKAQLLDNAIKTAGFDPQLGIVQRLAKEFTGELSAEAFKEFAVAEGLTPAAAETTTTTTTTERTETEQQLDRLQGDGDRLRDASTLPTGADDPNAAKAKALADGNIGALLDLEIATYRPVH